jgi:hypothetical protein
MDMMTCHHLRTEFACRCFVFNNGKDQFGCFNLVIMGGYLMLMTSTFGFSNKSNTIRGFSNMVPVWKNEKVSGGLPVHPRACTSLLVKSSSTLSEY